MHLYLYGIPAREFRKVPPDKVSVNLSLKAVSSARLCQISSDTQKNIRRTRVQQVRTRHKFKKAEKKKNNNKLHSYVYLYFPYYVSNEAQVLIHHFNTFSDLWYCFKTKTKMKEITFHNNLISRDRKQHISKGDFSHLSPSRALELLKKWLSRLNNATTGKSLICCCFHSNKDLLESPTGVIRQNLF